MEHAGAVRSAADLPGFGEARERYLELRADEAHLLAVLSAGAARAQSIASATLAEMKQRMGFV